MTRPGRITMVLDRPAGRAALTGRTVRTTGRDRRWQAAALTAGWLLLAAAVLAAAFLYGQSKQAHWCSTHPAASATAGCPAVSP